MRRFAMIALAVLVLVPGITRASASPEAIAVLDTEKRWVQALAAGDSGTVAKILDPNYVHVNYRGQVNYRMKALENARRPSPYEQRLSEQTVNFVDGVAIVNGVNSIEQNGKTLVRLRYTDIYHRLNGAWRVVWSQETTIAK